MLSGYALTPLLLATAPATLAPPGTSPLPAIEYVEITGEPNEAQLIAYGVDGEVLGSIAWWTEGSVVYLASDYADGGALLGIDLETRRLYVDDLGLPAELISARAHAFEQLVLAQGALLGQAKTDGERDNTKEWVRCGLHVLAAVGACSATAVSPIPFVVGAGCLGITGIATCECINVWAESKGKRKCGEDE